MLDQSLRGADAFQAAPASRLVRMLCLPVLAMLLACTTGSAAFAATGTAVEPILIAGIPVDFILFALTLLGVALFHHHTFNVAMTGLAAIVAYKLAFTGFKTGPGLGGFAAHLAHEWVVLANLFCLLMGFAILSRHFEKSEVPALMPRFLPDDWKGGFFCPCHGSTFDLAGRVYLSQPAPTNLEIPPHKWLSASQVLIGEDDQGVA